MENESHSTNQESVTYRLLKMLWQIGNVETGFIIIIHLSPSARLTEIADATNKKEKNTKSQ